MRGQAAPDPHLHVHMRVLNCAKGADGRWSAVDGRVLYHNIRSLNGLIEAELSSRLRARGYETVGAEHGEHRPWQSFELERVPEPLRDAMSQRQALVEQLAAAAVGPGRRPAERAPGTAAHLERAPGAPAHPGPGPGALAGEPRGQDPAVPGGAGGGLGTGDRRPRLRPPAAPHVPHPATAPLPPPAAERPSGDVAPDLAAWALGELGPARARQLALPAEAAHGMTGGQSVWTREELLDTVTPLGVARHLDA